MIDFEWYRSFISIYKYRSVSEAARARILTQPAMSQHLAALEAEIGEDLFIRAPRKMIPTEKGKELYTRIVPLVESLEAASLQLKMSASSSDALPVVKIGSPVEYFTERALERIKDAGIRCYSQFGIASVLLEKIQNDEIDIAITTQRLQIPGVEYTVIEEEEFVLTVPPSFEMTASKDVEDFLYNQRWISYGLELPIIRRFWRQHFKKRPEIQPHHVIPNLQTVLKAIQHHMGISLLPRYLIQEALREKKVKIELEHLAVKNQIFLAYKLKHRDHPVIQKTIRSLKKEEVEKE